MYTPIQPSFMNAFLKSIDLLRVFASKKALMRRVSSSSSPVHGTLGQKYREEALQIALLV